MLDKIIQKLKNLIPKKKAAEDKKVETPASTPASPPASGKAANNLDPKAKKRQLIIKIVAGIAVLYFALDEFVLKKETEEEAKPVASAVRHERKPKKSLKDLQKPTEKTAARDVTSVTPAEAPKEPPKAPAPEGSNVPPETPPVPAAEATPVPQGTAPEAISETTTSPEETTSSEPKPAETGTSGEPSESTMAAEGPTTIEKPTEEIAKDMEKVAEEVGPIPEEEIKPAEKVELPDYSIKGRGLVYNCTGKHWACIDREGYLNCKEHMKWTEENKKKPECVIKNVYASEEDCSVVQLNYINTNEPTDFCTKN